MKTLILILTTLTLVNAQTPQRLSRAESFLGIHFDFHAGPDCDSVGNHVDESMVNQILDLVQPDYIQIDCKGHRGYSSYPTQVGHPAPGFVRDPLKIWRQVTADRGVALYMHYSGVLDQRAVELHPDWAARKPDGSVYERVTSVFGPYVDELLIPQLKELSDVYQIDGVWVDGECWGTERDWSDRAIKAFRKKTGIEIIPQSDEGPHWVEFSQFHRQAFRDYLAHYVNALHHHNPDFQIASNWAYSSLMPEPVTVDVDFISGDYSPLNSVNKARLESRIMAQQGKPWDLMAWSFTYTWKPGGNNTKTIPQLQQEAAVVLSQGGGFQAYFRQKRDGSVYLWPLPLMQATAAFCWERQEISHKSVPVPQIGLILSTDAFYKTNRRLFAGWSGELNAMQGILEALLDGQHVTDIVMEHHLQQDIDRYPLLIYPEWTTIEPGFKQRLIDYVRNGGNLLVIGGRTAGLFESELGTTFVGEPQERTNGLWHTEWIGNVHSLAQQIEADPQIKIMGRLYRDWDKRSAWWPAASVTELGQGRIGALYFDFGRRYNEAANAVCRDFLSDVVDEMFPVPVVRVTGSHYVDVTLQRQGERLAVHLVNTAGPHDNDKIYIFDDIPPVGPLEIRVRTARPSAVTLQPGDRAV
ncbi:hypothetical protein GF406_08565, partial [candidate division KSB1 bacterium]|nr:hypothetical protein [candidate division KSB1 bacterium]